MYTYSFKDLSGTFKHPLMMDLVFAGQIGIEKIVIEMNAEKTIHILSADGVTIPVFSQGEGGAVRIECLQNSIAQDWLLRWHGRVMQEINFGEDGKNPVGNFASGSIFLLSRPVDCWHQIDGISIPKLGNKNYEAQAGIVIWNLPAARIVNG